MPAQPRTLNAWGQRPTFRLRDGRECWLGLDGQICTANETGNSVSLASSWEAEAFLLANHDDPYWLIAASRGAKVASFSAAGYCNPLKVPGVQSQSSRNDRGSDVEERS